MSDDDLRAELERLRQENAALKKGAARGVSLKVSEKGGLSVYGLGRFPVTLYKEQWIKLLDMSDEIRTFISTHDKELEGEGLAGHRRRQRLILEPRAQIGVARDDRSARPQPGIDLFLLITGRQPRFAIHDPRKSPAAIATFQQRPRRMTNETRDGAIRRALAVLVEQIHDLIERQRLHLQISVPWWSNTRRIANMSADLPLTAIKYPLVTSIHPRHPTLLALMIGTVSEHSDCADAADRRIIPCASKTLSREFGNDQRQRRFEYPEVLPKYSN